VSKEIECQRQDIDEAIKESAAGLKEMIANADAYYVD